MRFGKFFGFQLFVFTVDLDLISIQLRHAVNAKREAPVIAETYIGVCKTTAASTQVNDIIDMM